MVADDASGQAGQDRRQGGQPRPLRRVSTGRGRGAAAAVRDGPLAHRPAAGAARTGMGMAGQTWAATGNGSPAPWWRRNHAFWPDPARHRPLCPPNGTRYERSASSNVRFLLQCRSDRLTLAQRTRASGGCRLSGTEGEQASPRDRLWAPPGAQELRQARVAVSTARSAARCAEPSRARRADPR